MKKVSLFLLGGSLLFLTGCGTKYDLSCTMEAKEDSVGTTQELKFKYNDEKTAIEDVYAKAVIEVPSSITEEQLEQSEKALENICDDFDENVSCKFKRSGRKFTITLKAPFKDVIGSDLFDLMVSEHTTLEAVKETFEAAGYSCK